MGPWLADTIRQCDGLVDNMAYWSFSDVFEEQGVVKTPFYGGYGLIAADGIPKPAFNVFKLLHKLGEERIQLDSDFALLTRRKDGISRVDGEHGDVHSAYEKMGAPRYPSQKQIRELRQAAELPAAEARQIKHSELILTLPAHGLAVIELK